MNPCLFRHVGGLAVLVLACLSCLGCFCVARDALPASQGERLKAVPEGLWLARQQESPEDPVEETRLNMAWNEAERAYVADDATGEDPAPMLIRFYSLGLAPYYAVLASNLTPVEGDDCPAALFLARVQEGSIELVLPDQVDEGEHKALMQSTGVSMAEGVLSGSPEGLKSYLLGLAETGPLSAIQHYKYQGM